MSDTTAETQNQPFTVEQFYKFIKDKKIMAVKCTKCGSTYLPPRPMCTNCLSKELTWFELEKTGKLVTYTVIYIAPVQFKDIAPYAYGIVELRKGLRLPGIIKGIDLEKLEIGMDLTVDFDTETSETWPNWPKYYFRPP